MILSNLECLNVLGRKSKAGATLEYFCVWGKNEHDEATSDILFGTKIRPNSWDPELPPS